MKPSRKSLGCIMGVILLNVFVMPVTTSAQSSEGRIFADAISAIALQASEAALAASDKDTAVQAWDDAIAAVEELVPCNDVQQEFKEIELDLMNWQAAWYVCYYDYYLPLASGGSSVGEWLACVTPVNAGVIADTRARSEIYFSVLTTPCDSNYQPPTTPPTLSGAVYRAAQAAVGQFTEAVRTVQDARRALARGVKIVLNPERSGRAIIRLYTRKSPYVKIAQSKLIDVIADVPAHLVIKLDVPAQGLSALAGPPGPRDFQLEYTQTTENGEASTGEVPFTLGWKE
jgi:hypothetical protein